MASTPEETAWRVFVAATCPVNNNKYPYVVWQNWIEQNQLFGASAAALKAGERPRFHTSPLAEIMRKRKLTAEIANQDCNSDTKSGRTICEEARMSPDTQKYMVANNLTTVKGQEAFVAASKTFEFTPPSIEIKADWVKLASCTDPPQGVHVEEIAGTCYALAGMLSHFQTIPSLEEVVLVAHDRQELEVIRRAADGTWSRHIAGAGQSARLASIACDLAVAEVYRDPLAGD